MTNKIFLSALLIIIAQGAMSQTFRATSPSGHSLCYSITSTTEHAVSLVNDNSDWSYGNQFNSSSNVVISDTVYYGGVAYTVTGIAGQALNFPMYSLTIPRTMRTIGYHPFSSDPSSTPVDCNNTMHKLFFNADSCESSGGMWTAYNYWMPAFTDCHQLDTVVVGSHVKYLPYRVFSDCTALRCVVMGDSVHSIGEDAFFACSLLDSLRISPTLRHIGDRAFSGTAIRHFDLPNTLRTIGAGAFSDCDSLRVMIMPDGIDSVGSNLFSACNNLQRVRLSNNITHLYEQSFLYCISLSDVDLGMGIRVIDERVFNYCTSLHSVVLPPYLDTIKEGCFWSCTIDTITLLSTTPPVTQGNVFPSYGQNYAIPVYIPCGTQAAYQAAPTWSRFTNKIEPSDYTLTLLVDDTEMGRVEVSAEPTCTTPAIFTAIPNEGYLFTGWQDGDPNPERSVMLVSDTTFIAYFAVDSLPSRPDTVPFPDTVWRTLEVLCDSTMGTVSGGGNYTDSSLVTLTATPLDGYEFDRWDDGDTLNPRQVFVVSDTAFTALFRVAEDTVGIPENADKEVRLTVYPNPSHGEVTIAVNQQVTVSVTDLVGREIVPPTAVIDRLSMTALPVGVYLVRVSTDSVSSVKKLIVE